MNHDSKLRDVERRYRQTGSPDDDAALLRARVRVGDLSPERLALAACCGHEGARTAVGHAVLVDETNALVLRVAQAGRLALVTLAVGAAETGLRFVEEHLVKQGEARDPEWDGAHEALRAARSWLASPSAETSTLARMGADAAFPAAWHWAAAAAWNAALAVVEAEETEAERRVNAAVHLAERASGNIGRARAAGRAAVAAWALGTARPAPLDAVPSRADAP